MCIIPLILTQTLESLNFLQEYFNPSNERIDFIFNVLRVLFCYISNSIKNTNYFLVSFIFIPNFFSSWIFIIIKNISYCLLNLVVRLFFYYFNIVVPNINSFAKTVANVCMLMATTTAVWIVLSIKLARSWKSF